MIDDIIIEGLNISAMQRNFKKLTETVKAQGEMLIKQKDRIIFLERAMQNKSDDVGKMGYEMLNGLFNKKGK